MDIDKAEKSSLGSSKAKFATKFSGGKVNTNIIKYLTQIVRIPKNWTI